MALVASVTFRYQYSPLNKIKTLIEWDNCLERDKTVPRAHDLQIKLAWY